MKQLIIGILIGISLTAGTVIAVEGIDPFFDQLQRDRDRSEQERERWDQQTFRNEQRLRDMMPRTPC